MSLADELPHRKEPESANDEILEEMKDKDEYIWDDIVYTAFVMQERWADANFAREHGE